MDDDRRYTVQFNLFSAVQRLETLKQRRYSWQEIAKGAKVHVNTITRVANNETRRVDFDTLEGLLGFFEAEGMPIELSDLMTTKRVTHKAEAA